MKLNEFLRGRIFLLLFLFPCFSSAFAQTPRDTARVLLDSASYYIRTGDPVKAERHIKDANAIGYRANDSLVIMASTIGLINLDIDNGDYVDSLLDLMHPYVLDIGESRHFNEYYLDRAHVFNLRMEYGKQITYVDSALNVAIAGGDSFNIGSSYYELAAAYMNILDHKATQKAARQGLAVFRDLGISYFIAFGNRTLGVSFLLEEKPDSALSHFFISNSYFGEETNDLQIAYNNVKIGGCYVLKEDWEKAEKYLNTATTSLDKLPYVEMESVHAMYYMTQVYLNTDRPALALETAQKGYVLADSFDLQEDRGSIAELIIRANLMLNGIDQELMDTVVSTFDRAYEIGKAREVLDLRGKYESQEKEKRIAELALEAKESELDAQQTRTWLLLLLSAAVLIGMAAFLFLNRARHRTQRKMNELNRRALQLQINPHFFFNVLNSINHYITDNDQKAARYYLAKFARLMRLALENSQHEVVPLGNELDLVEAYLKLEQMRRDKFDFKIEVDEALRDVMVPPLMLQPFVENAVLHAFPDSMPDKGLIQVRASQEGDLLRVVVRDNGVGIAAKKPVPAPEGEGKTSLAIRILRKRLATLGNKRGGIDFGPGIAGSGHPGTVVRINIPVTLTP